MNDLYISLIVNIIILLVVFSLSIYFIFNLKNVSKGYKIFFISYIIFWIPLKLLRDYTSVIQRDIDDTIIWLPLMMYGLVGIFIRPLSDWLSLFLKNRKIILYLAIFIGIVTFIPILIVQNTTTNIIQSIGVGIGASMIGTYELMFKEQYTTNKSFLTVSIMAFPPLIADFISAPIQSSIKLISIDKTSEWNYLAILWAIGIFFYLLTALILFFIKEDRSIIGINTNRQLETNKNSSYLFVICLCCVGFLISFLKFSNSGSIATLVISQLSPEVDPNIRTNLQAYISTVFSLSQLLGTIFLAVVLVKKTNKIQAFTLGIITWIIYQLIIAFNENIYVYFISATLNGFSYGILYNLILAYVLTLSFKNGKIAPMGIYQSILSAGITLSTFSITYIKGVYNNNNNASMIINLSLIAGMILLYALYICVHQLDKNLFTNKFNTNQIMNKE